MTNPIPLPAVCSRITELESERITQGRRIIHLEAEVVSLRNKVRSLEHRLIAMEANYHSIVSLCQSIESRLPKLPVASFDPSKFVQSFRRPSTDFIPTRQIGIGNSSILYQVRDQSSGQDFAMRVPRSTDQSQFCEIVRRIAIPLVLNLPRVEKPFAICTDGEAPSVVMEFFPNGTLDVASKKWQNGRPLVGFGPTQLTKCVFGIAFTMAGFHARGGIHRDLRPCSIFLDSRFEPVIGNLWSATIIRESSTVQDYPGVPLYMAPERFDGSDYGRPVDVYSFAVLIRHLFEYETETWSQLKVIQLTKRICRGERMPRPSEMPQRFWELVEACWRQDPAERLTFEQIVDCMNNSEEIVFPGTNTIAYAEYRTRLLNERLDDPRPMAVIDAVWESLGWEHQADL
jgi:serine/threonine protein kinase